MQYLRNRSPSPGLPKRRPTSQSPGIVAPAAESDARAEAQIALEQTAAERSGDQPQPGITSCTVQLKPEFATGGDFYPGGRRVNYGGAVITVRYVLNAEGETVDDETAVVGDSSNATRPRFLDALSTRHGRVGQRMGVLGYARGCLHQTPGADGGLQVSLQVRWRPRAEVSDHSVGCNATDRNIGTPPCPPGRWLLWR